ncbi:MAG TPA: uroporphyrinogen-III synthase, partial [Rhodospirillales bacterium]|nr:uroporphyrinogen-III synthase [Rhodospirillales bacterium]
MRVLVTRPGKDGQDLVKILGDLGIDSMLEPLLTIRNLNTNSLNTEGVQAYLSTSANGINALINANPDYSIPLFAVGDATAVTARLGGFKTVHSASGDVSALANLVADILEPSGGSLI